MEDSSMTEEDESLSFYDETFEMEEEKKVEVGKVEEVEDPPIHTGPGFQFNYEVAEDSPIHTGPRFQFNYEVIRTLSWIFGLILILVFILARWSKNHNNSSIREEIIKEAVESPGYTFLNSKQLSFLWRFCNRTTFECSWCPAGWTEHDSRCYLMFNYTQTWEKAQEICSQCLGHLPVVLNARDQILLSRMAAEYREQTLTVHGVWIGLKDTEKEGNFIWVNGKMLTSNDSFWQPMNPNNTIPLSDNSGEDEDCVAIVPPINDKNPDWYYTWDDIICHDERHFICEIPLFLLEAANYMSQHEMMHI